jgi:divalent metal cation (Fe/Co/Zn/Cd) transporter
MSGATPDQHGGRHHPDRAATTDRDMDPTTPADTESLRRRALHLAWFIVAWDIVEGVVAVTAGIVANSIALIAFGIDSAIEVFAAGVVIWQLRKGPTDRQARALRLLAGTFAVLAAYITLEAVRDLLLANEASESPIGIALNVVALVVMVPVAITQRRIGLQLDNEVLIAQARETWISNALSISVLAGLGLNALFGWWQADPIAALLIAAVAAWSAREAWQEAAARHGHSKEPR